MNNPSRLRKWQQWQGEKYIRVMERILPPIPLPEEEPDEVDLAIQEEEVLKNGMDVLDSIKGSLQ